MERHRLDGRWREAMAAVQPAIFAEAHRDEKKRKQSYSIDDFTLTGLANAARKAERDAEKATKPQQIWSKIDGLMQGLGG